MGLFDNVFKEVGKVLDKAAGNQDFSNAIQQALNKKDEAVGAAPAQNAAQPVQSAQPAQGEQILQKGTVYDLNAEHSGPYKGTGTHEDIRADAQTPIRPFKQVKCYGCKGYEVPDNFMEYDSGAAEIEDCVIYTPETVTPQNADELYEKYGIKDPLIYLTSALNVVYFGGKGYRETGVPGRNTAKTKEQIAVWEDVRGKCGVMQYKAKVVNYYDRVMYFYGFDNNGSDCGFVLEYAKDLEGTKLEEKLHRIFDKAAATLKV